MNDQWDNGFYASGKINDCEIYLLVDSGSTASIISKVIFDKLNLDCNVEPIAINIADVSGNRISTYGVVSLPVTLGSEPIGIDSSYAIYVKTESWVKISYYAMYRRSIISALSYTLNNIMKYSVG